LINGARHARHALKPFHCDLNHTRLMQGCGTGRRCAGAPVSPCSCVALQENWPLPARGRFFCRKISVKKAHLARCYRGGTRIDLWPP
jgi:hypothetical protein